MLLVWRKRLCRCFEPLCGKRTWTDAPRHRCPVGVDRTGPGPWSARQVGQYGRTVAAIAVLFGVGWNTVMRAVRAVGQPLVDDPNRLDDITALGVDQHVWQHAGRGRRTAFGTGIVDLTPGRCPRPRSLLATPTRGHAGLADGVEP